MGGQTDSQVGSQVHASRKKLTNIQMTTSESDRRSYEVTKVQIKPRKKSEAPTGHR